MQNLGGYLFIVIWILAAWIVGDEDPITNPLTGWKMWFVYGFVGYFIGAICYILYREHKVKGVV